MLRSTGPYTEPCRRSEVPTQHTCVHGKCTNEVALGSDLCPEHGSIKIRFLYFLLDNRIKRCVQWPFRRNKEGYGQISGMFTHSASRYACAILNGLPADERMVGAHNCGNGHEGCVNPYHLRWATVLENAEDRRIHDAQRLRYGKTIVGRHGAPKFEIERLPVKTISNAQPRVGASREEWRRWYEARGGVQPIAIMDPELYDRLHPTNPPVYEPRVVSSSKTKPVMVQSR